MKLYRVTLRTTQDEGVRYNEYWEAHETSSDKLFTPVLNTVIGNTSEKEGTARSYFEVLISVIGDCSDDDARKNGMRLILAHLGDDAKKLHFSEA